MVRKSLLYSCSRKVSITYIHALYNQELQARLADFVGTGWSSHSPSTSRIAGANSSCSKHEQITSIVIDFVSCATHPLLSIHQPLGCSKTNLLDQRIHSFFLNPLVHVFLFFIFDYQHCDRTTSLLPRTFDRPTDKFPHLPSTTFATVTTFGAVGGGFCSPCGLPGPYPSRRRNYPPSHLRAVRGTDALEGPLGPRPSLGKVRSTQYSTPLDRPALRRAVATERYGSNSHTLLALPPRKKSLKEIVDNGPEASYWKKGSPYYVPRKSSLIQEIQKKDERRRESRQLDGSRSNSPSPGVSRSNTFAFNKHDPLQQVGTGSSVHSEKSNQSAQSSRSHRRTLLSRVVSAERDDRVDEGPEAREEQQLRESGTGANSEPDSPSHGGQGQRGFFGKYKGKGTRWVLGS